MANKPIRWVLKIWVCAESARGPLFGLEDTFTVSQTPDFAKELTHAIHQIQSYNDVVVNDYIGPVIAPTAEALNDDLPPIEALSDKHEYWVHDVACNIEVMDIPEATRVASDVSAGHDKAEDILQFMSTSLPDDIYHQKVSSLNKDQIRAFNFVKSHLQLQEPFHLFISDPGGIGKSHVISVIQELIKRVKLGQVGARCLHHCAYWCGRIQHFWYHFAPCLLFTCSARCTSRLFTAWCRAASRYAPDSLVLGGKNLLYVANDLSLK